MSMIEWAENEVKIACERELGGRELKEGEWDYGCACYQSALKAYKSLMDDGHSGFSFSLTKHVLIRLMNDQPLTPIEDVPEIWYEPENHNGETTYQCKRMGSLFKHVHSDGTIVYTDVDRVKGVDIETGATYFNYTVRDIIDKMFPITMPYIPDNGYRVYTETLLTDPKNGDYDTKGILYAIGPDGVGIEINRYFGEFDGEMKEIDRDEYEKRKLLAEGWKKVED